MKGFGGQQTVFFFFFFPAFLVYAYIMLRFHISIVLGIFEMWTNRHAFSTLSFCRWKEVKEVKHINRD